MKRDDIDYTIEELELHVAIAQGMTLAQLLAIDFPPADYSDENDSPIWKHDTVFAWLNNFNAARIATEEAQAPGTIAGLMDIIDFLNDEGDEPC